MIPLNELFWANYAHAQSGDLHYGSMLEGERIGAEYLDFSGFLNSSK
jgi:hypothetical protein